jgi:hypothetical protein
MSWNSSIQFAKLYKAYLSLSTTALTNPMIANLNMAAFNINNVNTINASSGTTLTLNADSAQGVTVSTKLLIPNHPLVITNNTVNDSLQVYDTTPDTTIFRVDHNGNVAVKADPSTTLTEAFTVNGSSTFVGSITVSGLDCGFGSFSGSLTAPTRSSGDNTTHVATTAFVQSAIPTGVRPVRNSAIQTFAYNPFSASLILSTSNPTANVFTIPLNASFNGCTNFTFYIRTLQTITTTNTGTSLQLRVYPSTTSTGQLTFLEGAIAWKQFVVPSTSTISLASDIIWNWVPSGGLIANTLYINIDASPLLSGNQLTCTHVDLIFDIIGDFVTLV